MKSSTTPDTWANEFEDFITSKEKTPPSHLSRQILSRIHLKLNPPAGWVFSKLFLIHGIVGSLTLLFCPQFGFAPLSDIGLMNLLYIRFGNYGCMLGCGAVYVGSSVLIASFLLKKEDIKVLRRNEFLQLPLLGLLSMAGFMCFGATIVAELTIAWLIGTLLGGLATLEIGSFVRKAITASN
jgi:hypothetical protein